MSPAGAPHDAAESSREAKLAIVPGGITAREYPRIRQVTTLTQEPLHVMAEDVQAATQAQATPVNWLKPVLRLHIISPSKAVMCGGSGSSRKSRNSKLTTDFVVKSERAPPELASNDAYMVEATLIPEADTAEMAPIPEPRASSQEASLLGGACR